MSMRQIIVLGVALMAAVVALFLVRGMASKPSEKSVAVTSVAPGIPVLVAAKALEAGDPTAPGDVVWINFPQEAVGDAFIKQTDTPNAATDMVGAIARIQIAKGEPITPVKLVKPGEQGFMAAMLTPGYRAVSIPITAQSAAAGFILPNDHVDVLATRKLQVQGPDGSREEVRSDIILQDVRILAIDQKFRSTTAGAGAPEAAVGAVATLELSARDSEVLSMAGKMGDLSLVLRGIENEPGRMNVASAERRGARVLRQGLEETGQVKVHAFGSLSEVPVASAGGGR
ncbi:MAG TPA: Flp pilus assembly protein CpaB [Caulobacterales bacterium]|nr:Flp pilus assembly protein CpaB [Caulobacterales bacterium]